MGEPDEVWTERINELSPYQVNSKVMDNTNENAIIQNINTERILKELEKKHIVIITGFQGINENMDITTFGRGGSDTSAVAVAAALDAKNCYIFSDVDGVYTADPNKIKNSKKLSALSYEEMLEISSEGAKVLHNRCIEIGEKFKIPIITKSTFNNKPGSVINNKIEGTSVKSIVKNDNIIYVTAKAEKYSIELFNKIYNILMTNNIIPKNLINNSKYNLELSFYINSTVLNKFVYLLENELNMLECTYYNVSRISIIGHGIMHDNSILEKTIKIINLNNLDILNLDIDELKISIIFKDTLPNSVLEQLHNELIQ